MTGILAKRRVALALLILLAGLAGFYAWSRPPRPVTPVPGLVLPAGLQARLLPAQAGLTPLPAQVTGRAAAGSEPGSYLHVWPALHVSARFQGTAVTLRFEDAVNRWRITLDGQEVTVSRPDTQDLRIEGLPLGPHEIRAEKISESGVPAIFGGFLLDADATALPAPDTAARLIEFIGDSDTVGFADTAERRDCTDEEIYAATDTSRAFGPQVARALGADYRIIARSGIGLLRNYGGAAPGQNMPQLYPLAVPGAADGPALPQMPADILVIGLGSNDFGSDFAAGEPWSDKAALSAAFGPALARFAKARMDENAGARLVLLAFGEYGPDLTQAYQTASDMLRAGGIASDLVVLDKPQRNACAWHPSAADHARIAQVLISVLKAPD